MKYKIENIGDVDLMDNLHFDTFLSVKVDHQNKPTTLFINYIIPIERKDKTQRLYGDLIHYFRKKNGFRFARGFMLERTHDGVYFGEMQYLYFDRKKATFEKKQVPKIYHKMRH